MIANTRFSTFGGPVRAISELAPEIREGAETNRRVLLVLNEAERSGADQLPIQVFELARFSRLPAYSAEMMENACIESIETAAARAGISG